MPSDSRMIAMLRDETTPLSTEFCRQVAHRLENLIREEYDRNRTIHEANSQSVGVWHWQGDGEDHPESLTCPILISAEKMRRLLGDLAENRKKPAPSDPIEAHVDQLNALGWSDADELLLYFRYDGTLTAKGEEFLQIAGQLSKTQSDLAQALESVLVGYEIPQVNVQMTPTMASISIGEIQVLCSESSSTEAFSAQACLDEYRRQVTQLFNALSA